MVFGRHDRVQHNGDANVMGRGYWVIGSPLLEVEIIMLQRAVTRGF